MRQTLKTLRKFALTLSTLGSLMIAQLFAAGSAEQPNIVLIFSDELPPEYIGAYGGPYPTPHIDSLAKDGMLFERAYAAAPMCTPSRFSLLTGLYPGRCRASSFLEDIPEGEPYSVGWNTRLHGEQRTIAHYLNDAGYTTGMVGKWHLGKHFDVPGLPEGETADSPRAQEILREQQQLFREELNKSAGFDHAASILWGNFDHSPVPKILRHHNHPWMAYGAVNFIHEQADEEEPFFLYLATTAVHGPPHQDALEKDPTITPGGVIPEVAAFAQERQALKEELADRPVWEQHKRAGMRALDHLVGEVLQALEEEGLAENTLVVFMPDHNIEPGKSTVYERGFRVPLLMRLPGHIPSGSASDSLVQSVDLMPTFVDSAGASVPDGLDGTSITPIWEDPETTIRDYIYYESGFFRGISDGHKKYITLRWPLSMEERLANNEVKVMTAFGRKQGHGLIAANSYPNYFASDQFYDLDKDPYELNNLIDDPAHAAARKHLRNKLEQMLESFPHPYPLERTDIFDTQAYRDVCERTRAVDLSSIWWIRRDHGSVDWPPASP